MADYSKFVALANRKIIEKGGIGTLKRTAPVSSAPTATAVGFNKTLGAPTNSAGVPTASTVLSESVNAVRGSVELTDVGSVPKYVTTFLMTTKPNIGDTLLFGDITYRIDSVAVLGPDGSVIVYRAKAS